MINLKYFLLQKDKIMELVKGFGFLEKAEIYRDESNIPVLIVFNNPEQQISYRNVSLLQAKIIELLECEVRVNTFESFDTLYHYHLQNNSAALDDGDRIKAIFGDDLEKIVFPLLDKNKTDLQGVILQQANKFLGISYSKPLEEQKENKSRENSPKRHQMFSSCDTPNPVKKPKLEFHPNELVITIPLPGNMEVGDIDKRFLMEKFTDFLESIKSTLQQEKVTNITSTPGLL